MLCTGRLHLHNLLLVAAGPNGELTVLCRCCPRGWCQHRSRSRTSYPRLRPAGMRALQHNHGRQAIIDNGDATLICCEVAAQIIQLCASQCTVLHIVGAGLLILDVDHSVTGYTVGFAADSDLFISFDKLAIEVSLTTESPPASFVPSATLVARKSRAFHLVGNQPSPLLNAAKRRGIFSRQVVLLWNRPQNRDVHLTLRPRRCCWSYGSQTLCRWSHRPHFCDLVKPLR